MRWLSSLALCAFFAQTACALHFDVTSDRSAGVYRTGEEAVFLVRAVEGRQLARTGSIRATVIGCDGAVLDDRTVDLARENPFRLRGKGTCPGVLRLVLKDGETVRKRVGVAFSPELIRQGTGNAARTDDVWAADRARLAREILPDFRIVRLPERSTATSDVYRVSVASFDGRIECLLSVPSVRPADGHSVCVCLPDESDGSCGADDSICLWLDGSVEFSRSALLGLDRLVDWIAARSDVNRSRVVCFASRRRAGFAWALLALNRSIRRAALLSPVWPETDGGCRGAFDPVACATRIRVPMRMTADLADPAASAETVFAAYGALASSERRLRLDTGTWWEAAPRLRESLVAWLRDREHPFDLAAKGMRLAWSDEFDGPEIDRSKWMFEQGFVRNEEPQLYTDRRENARIENGCLVLEARRERRANPAYRADANDWQRRRKFAEYTSAALETHGKFSFLYGRVDVRAKVPSGMGVWPAIWFMGDKGNWPACGEIDLMEYWGAIPTDPEANLHWHDPKGERDSGHASSGAYHCPGVDPTDGFHVYTLEWEPERLTFRYDGEVYGRYDVSRADQPDGSNPFRKPQFILLNLALLIADQDERQRNLLAATVFPQRFEVDYVRVWSLESGACVSGTDSIPFPDMEKSK